MNPIRFLRTSSRSQSEKLTNLVHEINVCFAKLDLRAEDIRVYLNELTRGQRTKLNDNQLDSIVEAVIKEKRVPDDLAAFEIFVKQLDELLDLDLSLSAFDSKTRKIMKGILALWATSVFVFVFYVVIGGIVEGHSALMKNRNPTVSILVFVFLLSLLAVVEGLQISVTVLRLKDLKHIRDEFPRVFDLHRQFRTEHGTNRFLSGRQLIVIIVVFFTAQLTSFPEMTNVPFTRISLPLWFAKIFLEFGVLGAFFVLWFGQLIPQFIANRSPQRFMELRPVIWVFQLAYFLEYLELTRPAHFIASWLPGGKTRGEDIAISPAERYRLEVEKLQGYGIIGLKKVWHVTKATSLLKYNSSVIFKKSGFERLSDSALLIQGGSLKIDFDVELLRTQNASQSPEINIEEIDELQFDSAWRGFVQTIRPRYGTFEANDVVLTKTQVEVPTTLQSDRIRVLKPTNYILFRVKFVEKPARLAKPKIQVYRDDDAIGTPRLVRQDDLKLLKDKEGDHYAEYLDLYPDLNTTYELSWEVDY